MSRSVAISNLGPLGQLRTGRLPWRLTQLIGGLILFGVSLALMVRAGLGLSPWDVLHSGIARWVPLSFGQVMVAASFAVLLLWVPLGERPGIGTLANAVVIGLTTDAVLTVLPPMTTIVAQGALLLAGVTLNGLSSALYIGAQLGRGPRDGLMTGLARKTGHSLRLVRSLLEIAVVLSGLALGGTVGVGTVIFALSIGALTQFFLPWVAVEATSS